ncbi:hypothetical protein GMB86_12815 [Terrilactibacillus sp. BCM23-1]|uniref:ABC-2 type transport system permease protein n=1 Tax=Terrilactibacillus tamarindi TaxID=2599694 RepID=A0A6N8CT99_9BACI|nr:hypothetical protein [Terrilactibacillus tamarindi]MTT32888.1 hypothetical protein [Terrilactibacillus tamarindi]
MSNILILLKVNLLNVCDWNKFFKRSAINIKMKMTFIILIIFIGMSLAMTSSTMYMYGLGIFLTKHHLFSYFVPVSSFLASLVMFILCLYWTSGYLLGFKDFNLLMSLPIKAYEMIISKLCYVYIVCELISVLICLPSFIIFGLNLHFGFIYYLFSILVITILPLWPMILGSLFTMSLGRVNIKLKSKKMGMMICWIIIILIASLVGYHLLDSISVEDLQTAIRKITTIIFPLNILKIGLVGIHIEFILLFMFIYLIPFNLFILVLSKSFVHINSIMSEQSKIKTYKKTHLKQLPIFASCVKKELTNYLSSFTVVMNTSFGIILLTFLLVTSSLLSINYEMILHQFMPNDQIVQMWIGLFSLVASLSCTTSSSISLEGQNLWIIKSLPIKRFTILKSKLAVNLILVMPLLGLDVCIVALRENMSIVEGILLLVIPSLHLSNVSLTGLLVNLRFPKLIWRSPMVVVKQSLSVLLTMLIETTVFSLSVGSYFIFMNKVPFLYFSGILIILLVLVNLLLWHLLKTKGVDYFNQL